MRYLLLALLLGCTPTDGKFSYYAQVWQEGLVGGQDVEIVFSNGTDKKVEVESECNTGEFITEVPAHSFRTLTVYSGDRYGVVECLHYAR